MLDRPGLGRQLARVHDDRELHPVLHSRNHHQRVLHGDRLDDLASELGTAPGPDSGHAARLIARPHTARQNQDRQDDLRHRLR